MAPGEIDRAIRKNAASRFSSGCAHFRAESLKLPKYLPHVTGIYVLLHLNQQGNRLPAHPEVNLGVMSSIAAARLLDATDLRLRIGQLPQGFQEPVKQLSFHYV